MDAGTLTVSHIQGVALICIRRADKQSIRLAQGASIELATIHSKIFVQTETGSPGFSDVVLKLTSAKGAATLTATALVGAVLLDWDADRDGKVELDGKGKANWIWGEEGWGAMVLVDNDADLDNGKTLEEREPIVIRPVGALPRVDPLAEGRNNFPPSFDPYQLPISYQKFITDILRPFIVRGNGESKTNFWGLSNERVGTGRLQQEPQRCPRQTCAGGSHQRRGAAHRTERHRQRAVCQLRAHAQSSQRPAIRAGQLRQPLRRPA
ncbi:hypothetical protein F2P45_11555 [Massilia sp. CCM 8733]|uniref:Protein-arginine deiminase (PAD) central domain-containing protein n=1 Tax=Massilia mucilaginosa TaxID=2609282 RepID=A0ABX0NSA2_9BURK|nr:hypothetical protein [Massilia mucilaginosa]